MTPQVADTREERDDNLPPTLEVPAVNGNGLTIGKATQEPNLPLFAQNDTQDFRARWGSPLPRGRERIGKIDPHQDHRGRAAA